MKMSFPQKFKASVFSSVLSDYKGHFYWIRMRRIILMMYIITWSDQHNFCVECWVSSIYSKQHAIKPKSETLLKTLMKNHSHKKKKKASSPLTVQGSLLQLTIHSPRSLIYPQEGRQLGIGCANFSCCGNVLQFLWPLREVLVSSTLIPHAVPPVRVCAASLSLPWSTSPAVSLQMHCKRCGQAGQKMWSRYHIIKETDITHFCSYTTLFSLQVFIFCFRTWAQFSENIAYYAKIYV